MKRIRTLGIAAVMAMALTAMAGAGTASASGFVANQDPFFANLTGTAGESGIVFSYGNSTTCTGLNFQGEMEKASSSYTSATVSEGKCTPSLQMNGCKFIFHTGSEYALGAFNGTIDIGPPGCGPITTSIAGSKVSIHASTGLVAKYVNLGAGNTATVKVSVSGGPLKYKIGKPFGNEELKENGKLDGSWTIKADRWGQQVGLAVQPWIPVAIGLGTKEGQTAFASDTYPVGVRTASSSTAVAELKTPSLSITTKCPGVLYESGMTEATSELAVDATYSGCKTGVFPSKLLMHDCQYEFELTSASGGTNQLSCSEGGAVELLVFSSAKAEAEGIYICKAEFAPRAGTLSNLSNSNPIGTVSMDTAISGIKYTWTRKSAVCPGTGTGGVYEDGAYSHKIQLIGSE